MQVLYSLHFALTTAESLATDGREYGMQNLGVMVPLLDILNHDSSQEWLRFEVKDEALQVICNVPRKKVVVKLLSSILNNNYSIQTLSTCSFRWFFCAHMHLLQHLLIQDQELFSNYGALSNEVLMYAYGFALENNPFDTVTLKLVIGGNNNNNNNSDTSPQRVEKVYSISTGGLSGVPKVLVDFAQQCLCVSEIFSLCLNSIPFSM